VEAVNHVQGRNGSLKWIIKQTLEGAIKERKEETKDIKILEWNACCCGLFNCCKTLDSGIALL